MNQFLVPQFIGVEPNIIFGLKMRQFLIIVFGIVVIVLCYKLADTSLFIVEAVITLILVILIGFVPINGRSFPMFFLDLIYFALGSNVRVWKKDDLIRFAIEGKASTGKKPIIQKETIKKSKLSELSLVLDTSGAYEISNNYNENIDDIDLD